MHGSHGTDTVFLCMSLSCSFKKWVPVGVLQLHLSGITLLSLSTFVPGCLKSLSQPLLLVIFSRGEGGCLVWGPENFVSAFCR